MAKILIVIEKDCDPPSDGVSIAVNSISSLLTDHDVSYFIYGSSEFKVSKNSTPQKITLPNLPQFDIVLSSPINSTLYFLKNKKAFKYHKCIALLSDCYTYAVWKQIILAYRFNFFTVKYVTRTFLRMIIAYFKELRIAYSVDLLLFQTKTDTSIFKKIFPFSKVENVPNVPQFNNHAENLNLYRDINSIAFVASFAGSYLYIANWFFKKIWPQVLLYNKNARIYLLGKGSKEYFNQVIKNNYELKTSVFLENYYPDISVFFKKMHMSVSPIFKGYGLINKTVEAMQNGCITVGDKTAFNGLGAIVSGTHCFMAENADEFINAINLNFNNDHMDVRAAASGAVFNALNKKKYIDKVNVIVNRLL
ncbi:glycosyltransferase family 4 protein [Mucilaginibacter sp.]|uniref:glycosyltransferase family 4 protein n=1 Tax=Mucilaginibacter sp. TaxID=1882438 RepID=UPI002625A304|nr:glycosyltransferase family 4 protein [Mucilaginibacter sp.]MDB4919040.1 hypothetical protein [Mucilaginibacter sp.]